MPAGGVAGPTSSDLWCALSACRPCLAATLAMAPSPGARLLALPSLLVVLHAALSGAAVAPDAARRRWPEPLPRRLHTANHEQRQQLTSVLLAAWATTRGPPLRPRPKRRCRASWGPRRPLHHWTQRLRRRCGFAGCRVGEATNPGPASPGTPLGGERQPMAVDASGSHGRERSAWVYAPLTGFSAPSQAALLAHPAAVAGHLMLLCGPT